MSVEATLVAQAIASSALLNTDNCIHGDFGDRDPGYPRVRLWRRPGAQVTIAFGFGICNIDSIVQADIYTKTASGSTAEVQAVALATELITGLNGFIDLPNDLKAAIFEDEFDQPSDRGGGGDDETFHRILLFRALAQK